MLGKFSEGKKNENFKKWKKHRQIVVRADIRIALSKTRFEGLSFTDQKDNNILKFKLAFISNDRNISHNSFVDELRVNEHHFIMVGVIAYHCWIIKCAFLIYQYPLTNLFWHSHSKLEVQSLPIV